LSAPGHETGGHPVQAPPADLPSRATQAPILPPLANPQPSWKQEGREGGPAPTGTPEPGKNE